MSEVHKAQQTESYLLYKETARQLVSHSTFCFKRFPKTITFLLTNPISEKVNEIYYLTCEIQSHIESKVISSNFILEKTNKALANLDFIDGMIGITKEIYESNISAESVVGDDKNKSSKKISDFAWTFWGELIYKERELLKELRRKYVN